MSVARAVVVLDRVHEDVGHLGPLYAATASEEGLWVGGANSGSSGRATLLFSPDAVRFEPRTPPHPYSHRTLLALPDGRLLAGGRHGLAKSIDGGFTWTEVPGWQDACWRLTVAVDGTLWGTSTKGIASSMDGEVWTRFESPDALAGFEGMVAWDSHVFAVHRQHVHALHGGRLDAVHRFPGHELHGMARTPDGLILVVGSGGLVARSRDGARWQTVQAGAQDLHDVVWCGDRFLMAGAGGALLATTDGEQVTPIETDSHADAWLVLPFRGGALICGETTTRFGGLTTWGSLVWLGPPRVAAPAQPGEPVPARRRSRAAHAATGRARLGLADFEVLSVAEAVRRYPPVRTICEYDEPDVVRLYSGDLILDHYETPDDLGRRSLVIVDGDLWTEHQVELDACADDDDRIYVFVAGCLSAHDVSLDGDPWLFIGGDLDVTDLVVCGGGSEGILDVGGALRARAVVAAPWANVKVRGDVDAIVVAETGLDKTKGRRFAPRQVLLPAYVNDNDDPDVAALQAAIESGVDPLRDTLPW